ncbi:MAG: hypothetical protein AAGI01_05110 [Myxococcota bacterium]
MAKKKRQSRSASASYKRDLDKLFDSGGEVPERFKEVLSGLEPEEGSEEAAWLEAVRELREVESFRDFARAATKFRRAGHALPDDEVLLVRLLDHPSEVILHDVLAHLVDLHDRRTLKRPAPIKSRLSTIEALSEDPKIAALVATLREVL